MPCPYAESAKAHSQEWLCHMEQTPTLDPRSGAARLRQGYGAVARHTLPRMGAEGGFDVVEAEGEG